MRISGLPLDPARIAEFTRRGYWTETTSNDVLERLAHETPDKLAIVDERMRLGYGDYFRRAE
jgi:non-ribosomal peptide synthetase component E (peptide arylation enzyme)